MMSLSSDYYQENKAGKKLTGGLAKLLGDSENFNAIGKSYMSYLKEMGNGRLAITSQELSVFIGNDDYKYLKERLPADSYTDYYTDVQQKRGHVDFHNICSAISAMATDKEFGTAMKKADKNAEVEKLKAINKAVGELVKEAGDCELKTLLKTSLGLNLQRGSSKT